MKLRTILVIGFAISAPHVSLAQPDPPPPPPPPPPPAIALQVQPLFQTDPAWRGEHIDHSESTIGGAGCHLTSLTMVVNYYLTQNNTREIGGDPADGPIQYTPADINNLLITYVHTYQKRERNGTITTHNVNGFGQEVNPETHGLLPGVAPTDGVSWGGVLSAVKQDTARRAGADHALTARVVERMDGNPVTIPEEGSNEDLNRSLERGNPVVVRVDGNRDRDDTANRDSHSVVVTGWDPETNSYIVVDPYSGNPSGVGETEDRTRLDRVYHNTIFGTGIPTFRVGGSADPFGVPAPYPLDPDDIYDPILNPDQWAASMYWESSFIPAPGSVALAALGGLLIARRRRTC